MNVQFRYCGAFVSGVLLQNLVDFRIVTTSSFYPVNPVDPVKILRSGSKATGGICVTDKQNPASS